LYGGGVGGREGGREAGREAGRQGGREAEREGGREGGRRRGLRAWRYTGKVRESIRRHPGQGTLLLFGTWSSSEAAFIPGSHVIGERGYSTHSHW
jgi:hypothetical protein